MHPDMLLLTERIVIAIERMSEEVKNMSASVSDLSYSVSHFLNDKREKEGTLVVSCNDGIRLPLGAPVAEQVTSAKSENSLQHEEAIQSSVLHSGEVEQEDITVGDVPFTDIDRYENSDILTSFPERIKVEEQSESEKIHNTFNSSRNNETNITEEVHDEIDDIHEEWISFQEENDNVPIVSPKNEESFKEMNLQHHIESGAAPSTQCPSTEVTGMNDQKLSSALHEMELFHCLPAQKPFPVAHCSRADDAIGQEETAGRLLSEGPGEQHVASLRQINNAGARDEETYFQIEAQSSGSFTTFCEGKESESRNRASECSTLEKTFASESRSAEPLRCSQCNGSFSQKSFKCSQCGKTFTHKSALNRHMRVHTGDRPYRCCHCGNSFTDSSSLTVHIRSHTGEKPYKCSLCEMSFARSGACKKHIQSHSAEQLFNCSLCGKSFKQRNHLGRHMRAHTSNRRNRRYSCCHCSKSFTDSSSLTVHMRSHSGEKPYKCLVCDMSFSRSGSCKLHMRIHSGERPFSCSQCGLSFIQRHHLRDHMHIHTGESPYSCTLCGNRFKTSSKLSQHRHRLHAAASSAS